MTGGGGGGELDAAGELRGGIDDRRGGSLAAAGDAGRLSTVRSVLGGEST